MGGGFEPGSVVMRFVAVLKPVVVVSVPGGQDVSFPHAQVVVSPRGWAERQQLPAWSPRHSSPAVL